MSILATGGYVSPYGKPRGLVARLVGWADRMGTDHSLPWAGLGIIGDIKLAAQILNSREFLENLRTNGTTEQADFARELLEAVDTVEAIDDAAYHARDNHGLGDWPDPVQVVEALDAKAGDYAAVRAVLVETGALGEGDTETPIADLVRALLS